MRRRPPGRQLRAILAAAAATSCVAAVSRADDTPADYLQIEAPHAQTFVDGGRQVVLVDTPLIIRTDTATMQAKTAVIWFRAVEGAAQGRQQAEIVLIGDATLTQGDVVRSGDKLFVGTVVGGPVRLSVRQRESADLRGSELYRLASDLRPTLRTGADRRDNVLLTQPSLNDPPDLTRLPPRPTTLPTPKTPVFFNGGSIQTTKNTPDGKIAVVLRGNVLLTYKRENGDFAELQADEAVLFTNLTEFTQSPGQLGNVQDAIQSAYLEGDVRIGFTPAADALGRSKGEQRLRAKQAYYEFATDRAVLNQVVIQATDPQLPYPITMRANYAKQLSQGEFKAEGVTLTTSQFASPSYSVNASKAYVRQYADTANPEFGNRTTFEASNATLRAFGVPFFYFPYAAGDFATKAFPLRGASFGSTRATGFGVQTTWGLFESFGRLPPPGVDAQFHADYFSDRGPATGLDASYQGGPIAETTKGLWNFKGDFTAYGIYDNGQDILGRDRAGVDFDDEFRGRVQWQHQQILSGNWQTQFRIGLTSDATFLEEFYRRDFVDGEPTNLSAYAKHQDGNEAVTLLAVFQPNGVVTNSDAYANRFVGDRDFVPPGSTTGEGVGSLADRPFEVDRLPEVGYFRLGQSFDDDTFTFHSENRVGGYRFNQSNDSLGGFSGSTGGFRGDGSGFRVSDRRQALPGVPSLGYTGTTEDYVVRGDFRQEIDYPLDAGRFKVVPYVFGRYTGYSDGPDDNTPQRLMAGVGTRINTAFWKIDDAANNDFFDVHRVRHVIEPELNLFASAATVDRTDVYVYDDTIDGISDVSAVSFFIRQKWQTKRGAPGLFRSVDFLTLNLGIIGFANTPDEPENPDRAYAEDNGFTGLSDYGPSSAGRFRGLFFQSTPEASIARSSIQGDASWRVADTTVLLTDANWNIEEQQLATTAIGLAVGRGDRVSYYTGLRYIGEIDSTIASFNATYQLTAKYSVTGGVAIDLARDAKGGNASILRKFDRFVVGVGGYYDQTDNESGVSIAFYPEGLAGGVGTNQLSQFSR